MRLRVVSVLVIALGSAALLAGPGIDSTVRAQTPVDYDADDDGLIEVTTVAQLNAIRWDLNGDGDVDPGGDATLYGEAFPSAMASMGCATTGCTGYELTEDLNLQDAGDSATGWEPIGGMASGFTATFDGGAPDVTVSNLFIDSSMQGIGLFGAAGGGSVIRNVTLANVDITGGHFTGALVGRSSGLIIDSGATGAVSGDEKTGGLVGASVHPGGVIVGSTAGVEVTDTGRAYGEYIGGLVGYNAGPIIDSHSTGNVDGARYVGGLVGASFRAGGVSKISGSTAAGTVIGTGVQVGGLVGSNNGPISSSHATGNVRGFGWVGGLVGSNDGAGDVNRISGSTAAGTVTGTVTGVSQLVGGLVGRNNGPISSSHATGNVRGSLRVGGLVGANNGAGGVNRISGSTASGTVTGDGDLVGGLVGWNNGPIIDSHAIRNVEGVSYVGGLVGSNDGAGGVNRISGSTASGTVTGTGNLVGGLVGSNNGPISDSDARGAQVSGHLSVGGLVGWNNGPISDSHASGSVQALTQSGGLVGWNSGLITDSSASGDVGDAASLGESVGGLVGLNKEGTIRGSNATGDVTSTSSTIGGLVGRNEGTITESAASGAVIGDGSVGGLVGYDRGVSSGDSISASRASGNVTGSGDAVGGLAGWSEGTIRASYATGTVSGATEVGGLVGRLGGAIITSYASGDVSGSGDAVGGLVGQSVRANIATLTASSVLASYATGSVSGGATNLGGLIGLAQAPTSTYAGPSFTDSYWDTERSSESIGVGSDDADANGSIDGSETATSGVTGQTTSALQMPTDYAGIYANWNIDSGDPWDFGGSTDDPELRAPPNDPPAFSSTAVDLTVAEDAALGSNVGAAVTATDSDGDTLTYKLGGAGGAAFDVDGATGQLQVRAALDHETNGSYTVSVQASDGKSVAFKSVTVTVTGVDEPPALSGDDAPAVADNGAGFVSTYTLTDPEGDAVGAITWSLAGADSSYFTIEDGRLSFRATPDYENPNHGVSYAVTVQAAVTGLGSPLTLAVTATVVNVNEAGVVSLSMAQPVEGVALTATLSDPDGGVSGVTWEWARATSTNGPWTDISGETSATYTPTSADASHYLRATASYDDAEGSGKGAQGISDNPLSGGAGAIIVTPTSLTVGEGGSSTYTVVLGTQPTGDVTVTIVDPMDNTDVTVEPATLTFTTTDWAAAQSVTVRAAEDDDASDDTATVTHTVSGYGTVSTVPEVSVTVRDNDTRGVTVTPTQLTISEGSSDTYDVVLDTQPTGSVTVTASSDNGDVTVSPASLTFIATDWDTAREVTVSAAQDNDQTEEAALVTHMVSGADYNSVTTDAVAVKVVDDESPDTANICGRTPEVRDWILSKVGISDCAAITNTDLGGIKWTIDIASYSSPTLLDSDFEGLTGEFFTIFIRNSPALRTVPSDAFDWVANKPAVTRIHLENASIETVEDGVFDGFTGLTDLSLVRNAIKTLDPGVFSGLTSLIDLGLFSNDIAYLPENVFSGLTNLQVLDISENRLTALPVGVFSGLTSLQQLSLADNRLTALQAGVFTGLSSLYSLDLSDNRLTTLQAGVFTGLSSLDSLYLNRNDLAELPANTLANLPSLGKLYLQGNSLTALEPTLFAPVKNTLRFLRLDDNRLTALPANVFSGLTKVRLLYLGGNAFTTLPASVFGDMTSLGTLFLEEGALTTLPSGAFTGLTSLTELYLDGNAFETLPSGAFTGLTSLTYLYLDGNDLATLPSGAFTGLTSLTYLYLNENALTTLPSDVFTGLTRLKLLNLHGNKFMTFPTDLFDPLSSLLLIDLGENQLATLPNIFDDLTTLVWLYLNDNDLATLPSGAFTALTSLSQLYLNDNDLATLPSDAFTGLTSLSQLYLNDNDLATLPSDAFTGLTGLQRLDLSDNSLTVLPLTLFGPTVYLERLYLRDNGLTALAEGIFAGLTSLQDLDLSCNALTEFDLTDPTPFDPFAGTLSHLDVGANSFTIVPSESAVRTKLTALETLYLTGATLCLPPGNTDLSALTVSAGTLTPPFEEPGMTSAYEVTVAHDVAAITITLTLKDSNAAISRIVVNHEVEPTDNDFTDGVDVALLYGWNEIRLYVKSKDRRTDSSYRVLVTREHPPATDARLRGLTLSHVTLEQEFDSDVFAYTADADATVAATTVTPVPSDPDATAVIKLNGVADPDGTVDLVEGANTVTVEVTAEDGVMMQTYTVTVTLAMSGGAGAIDVTPPSLTVAEGYTRTYTVALNTQPTGDVTVTIVDPADNTDVTAEPAALTFTTTDWETAQTVTVSAVQDADMDDETATVTHTVSGYGSVVTAASVTVTVSEDPTVRYDTNGNGAIEKSEASVALRDYLEDGDSGPFGGTTSKALASAVLRRYLERS